MPQFSASGSSVPSASSVSTAWYRQPIIWLMITLTLSAVVACIYTLLIAIEHKNDMVTEDYYKHGKAINQVLEREQQAAALELQFSVRFTDEQVVVNFLSGQLSELPALTLSLYHRTLASEDLTLPLHRAGDSRFVATLPKTLSGRWDLRLEPVGSQWRIQQPVALPRADTIIIGE